MLATAPEHAQSMNNARSGARVYIMQTHLRRLTLRTCVVWKSSRESGVKLGVFQDPGFDYISGKWTGFDVDVGGFFHVYALLPYQHCHHCLQETEYRDMLYRNTAFKIDDSIITESGFTYRAYPAKFTGNSFILTNTDILCIKVYSNNQTGDCFAVGFRQFLGKDWIHVESEEYGMWGSTEYSKEECAEKYAKKQYDGEMLARAPERPKASAGSEAEMHRFYYRFCSATAITRSIPFNSWISRNGS